MGPVNGEVMRTLMAVTGTLIGAPIERGRYKDFFSWHAANISDYRDLYERMAAMLDRMGTVARKPLADFDFEE